MLVYSVNYSPLHFPPIVLQISQCTDGYVIVQDLYTEAKLWSCAKAKPVFVMVVTIDSSFPPIWLSLLRSPKVSWKTQTYGCFWSTVSSLAVCSLRHMRTAMENAMSCQFYSTRMSNWCCVCSFHSCCLFSSVYDCGTVFCTGILTDFWKQFNSWTNRL